MDLEVKEVAELLNVTEEILHDWIREGTIPAYFLKERFHFNRQEIEDWVIQQGGFTSPATTAAVPHTPYTKKGGQLQFALYRALLKGDLYSDITGDDKLAVIKATMKRLSTKLKLDSDVLTELFMERENIVPTAIGQGFAIPHARDFFLPGQHDVVAIVFLEKPISYGALDDEPVHTLFFVLACDDKRHLSLLSKIAHIVSSPTMRAELAKKPDRKLLLELMHSFESKLKR